MQLFDRDRWSVSLTPGGATLLPEARALVNRADALRRAAAGLSPTEIVRTGYVNWCPTDWAERAAGVAQLRVDAWVMPSHIQAARVAKGSLDLAICWVQNADLEGLRLRARIVGADRLYAVDVGTDGSPVDAGSALALVDADEASWESWNRFAEQFADEIGAPLERVGGGGVTGPTFFEHVRRLRRPILVNPKGLQTPVPPGLIARPIVNPTPCWTWSLVLREDEDTPTVHAVVDALTRATGPLGLDGVWLPKDDPYSAAG